MCSPTRTRIGPGGERLGQRLTQLKSARRGGEGEEEGVSLRVHLDAVVRGARLSDDSPVLGECFRVRLCAELVQQPRRSLNVREEEGDGAGREIASHAA